MAKIPLSTWAEKLGVSRRTAQIWAKTERIKAELELYPVVSERTIKVYMIDKDAKDPRKSK